MYQKCPKCGFKNSEDKEDIVCPQCGLIFDKWLKNKYKSKIPLNAQLDSSSMGSFIQTYKIKLLYVPENILKHRFYLNLVIYILFFVWGWSFIVSNHYSAELNNSFMHLVNLVFHEAGHVIFRLFGQFMSILGGSLLQLLVPVIFLFSFLKRKDTFAASIMLWWLAQSMMDLVAYIDDAQRQEMWLLGGVQGKDLPGIHDWNNILSQLGLLNYDHFLATLVSWLAIFVMFFAFFWGAALLKKMMNQ
ncbi:MAG: zinc ribbon domain-containing protein [Gammaproteobacteria bacterium]|nr:zinc ribbon domain-containing protein [Gammaproteobacteria bacterium]